MENFVNQMQEEVGAFDKLYLRKIQVTTKTDGN